VLCVVSPNPVSNLIMVLLHPHGIPSNQPTIRDPIQQAKRGNTWSRGKRKESENKTMRCPTPRATRVMEEKKKKVVLGNWKRGIIKRSRLHLSSHGRQLPSSTSDRWNFAKDGIGHIILSSAHIQLLQSLDNNRHDSVTNLVDFGVHRI